MHATRPEILPAAAAFKHLPPMTDADVDAVLARARSVPIYGAMHYECTGIGRGVCRFAWDRDPKLDGIFISMHGGLMMTLADSVAAFALLTVISADSKITTTEMNIRFFAPVRDRIQATATVLKAGRTLCPIVVDVTDEHGQIAAHAGMTYMRLPHEGSKS